MSEPPILQRPAPRSDLHAPKDAAHYEILIHAEALFGHYGFRKTSMADIAERAKMSPGNLYRYFRNKQAIGIAVVELFFRESEAAIEAALISLEGPETRIRALISTGCRLIVEEMARDPKLMELVEWLTEEDDAWAKLKGHIAWKRQKVVAELEAGVAAGIFADRPIHESAVNLMHATKAFQMPQSLASWRDVDTILPELDGVLDLVFSGLRSYADRADAADGAAASADGAAGSADGAAADRVAGSAIKDRTRRPR